MVRTCKYSEPQVKQNVRTTPTCFSNVNKLYINTETPLALNIGDLLDEIGMGNLVILHKSDVPCFSSAVIAQSVVKCSELDQLLVAKVMEARAQQPAIPQAGSLHRIHSSDLHTSQKKRRIATLAEKIEGLSSDYLTKQDFNLVLDQVVAERLFEVSKQKVLRVTPEEHKAGLTARPWDDPELRLKHLMVKMRALVSNTSWAQLRVDAELQGILTPEYMLKDMKRLAVQYTVEQLNIRQFTINAEVTPETNPEAEPPLIHCTSVDLEAAMICAIDV